MNSQPNSIVNTKAPGTFQSRWGFHPCEYAFYLKLKYLKKHYWQALREFHHWHRWWRKEPQNRIGKQPGFCAEFSLHEVWHKPYQHGEEAGYKIYPIRIVDHGILDYFERARIPTEEPVELFGPDVRQRIEVLYEKVHSYFED